MRLARDHDVQHSLKDIMVWREEEMFATEVLANAIRGHGCFYIFARGIEDNTLESLYRLIFKPDTKKVYPSFRHDPSPQPSPRVRGEGGRGARDTGTHGAQQDRRRRSTPKRGRLIMSGWSPRGLEARRG